MHLSASQRAQETDADYDNGNNEDTHAANDAERHNPASCFFAGEAIESDND
jgi:hypothetical protein